MAKFFVQVLVVKEIEVEASDELQAERAAFAKLGREKHSAIGLKTFPGDDFVNADESALTDDNIKNMECVRKHFHALDTSWCEGDAG